MVGAGARIVKYKKTMKKKEWKEEVAKFKVHCVQYVEVCCSVVHCVAVCYSVCCSV